MQVVPVTLEGRHVRLEPLSLEHHPGLCEVGLDPDLWRWTIARITTPEELRRYLEAALRDGEEGSALPFATVERASGRPIGSTRFGNLDPRHLKAEIGWTWIGTAWQRTEINTEAKFLMLRHAFETWGCRRVELKTSALNHRSRAAILRIGATEEGTLRKHMINDDGTRRDSVFFSILDDEWPDVKVRLERLMEHAM